MDNIYINDEVDLIISRFIKIEKNSKNYINNRSSFYLKMNKSSEYIKSNIGLLHPWNKLFEETMFLLHELYNIYFKQKKTKVPAMLLSYILKLSNSMKILFHAEYLEMGLIIHRTIIENIQLELISITDVEFCKNLLDENKNANEFWHKNLSKGKLAKKIKEIFKDIEINMELIILGKDELERLSECVHASSGTPLMMIEPIITDPNLVHTEPFGIINYHSIETYIRIIQNYLEYTKANLKLILNKKTWFTKSISWDVDINNILINYNAISKCFYEYYFPQYENNKELWNIENFMAE
jgi:hypothetical protein